MINTARCGGIESSTPGCSTGGVSRGVSRSLTCCLLAIIGCGKAETGSKAPSTQSPSTAGGFFKDITDEAGIDFRVDRVADGAYFMPDSMAAGAAIFDFDADGRPDIYLVNGYRAADGRLDPARGANRLYRQTDTGGFVDVTARSGLGDGGYGMGVAVGDVDNDGDLDVYLTNYGPDAFYRNNGDGTFANVTAAAGLGNDRWAASAGFFDYDLDGYLDLFVTNYVALNLAVKATDDAGRPDYPGPSEFPGVPDLLYHNNRDGTFTDVSAEAGIGGAIARGLGVAFVDLDRDGRQDVYVANDGQANFAWINLGDGVFEDRAVTMGLALNYAGEPEAGMGVAAGDCDGDGNPDLLVTHLAQESNTLYRSLRSGVFEDVTFGSGLGAPSVDYTCFGTAFLDFDHDGDLDLLTVNGRVVRTLSHPRATLDPHWNPYAEPNQLYENDGGGRFTDVSNKCGPLCDDVEVSRGLAVGDIDGDSDLDILLVNGNGTVRLFRNDAPKKGRWLRIRALDPTLQRDAVGAEVRVFVGGRILRRDVTAAGSYLSSSELHVHFGLGRVERVDDVRIRWPDGAVESFGAVEPDRTLELIKGSGRLIE